LAAASTFSASDFVEKLLEQLAEGHAAAVREGEKPLKGLGRHLHIQLNVSAGPPSAQWARAWRSARDCVRHDGARAR